MAPFNKFRRKFLIVNIGLSLCSLYKKGINTSTIFPSSGLIDTSKIHLPASGIDVNNKLYKEMNQSSIIVCPLKLLINP